MTRFQFPSAAMDQPPTRAFSDMLTDGIAKQFPAKFATGGTGRRAQQQAVHNRGALARLRGLAVGRLSSRSSVPEKG
jgi:hypothetical protein